MDFFFRQYGQGTPVIILHGWLGVSDNWISIGKFLSTQGFNVIIPDLPNHGKTFHTEEFSYKEMAEIIYGFCKVKELEKPVIIGHSMGGKIAMEMINIDKDYFKSLIVVDIHFKEYTPNAINSLLVSTLIQTNISQFKNITQLKEYLIEQEILSDFIGLILKNVDYSRNKISWRSNIPLLAKDYSKVLEKISISKNNIPTLLLRGENSNYVLDEDINSFKEVFKNSKVKTIPNSGHWVLVDNPAMLIKEIVEFLK
ncbi:MAG: Pimeloyl-ACP methyl ester carboxylesterase [Bacteroidetes bacterium]|nr:Pimeloyl-ACP methyl ester carboxylesterase [Bacteroidota bacterium]